MTARDRWSRGRGLTAFALLLGLTSGSLGATSAGAPNLTSSAPRAGGAPTTSALGWTSSNWSGYAKTGSGFKAVTGNWIVPTVTATLTPTYSSAWIGIDGFTNSSLIQTGTEEDYYGGAAHYLAWWEILPASETPISSLTIHPGDHMSASITQGTGSKWTIKITDVTTGHSFSIVKTYTGPRTSVEWILEAPSVGGTIAQLAHYGQTTFDPGTVNGANPHLASSNGGAMVQTGAQVSTPSNQDGDTDGFNVKYGSTQPPPPTS